MQDTEVGLEVCKCEQGQLRQAFDVELWVESIAQAGRQRMPLHKHSSKHT
jgi:hypothetical protein